jgi:hypothetical protein
MTLCRRPRCKSGNDSNVLRPMINGLPIASFASRRKSFGKCHGIRSSLPITPFSATAATIRISGLKTSALSNLTGRNYQFSAMVDRGVHAPRHFDGDHMKTYRGSCHCESVQFTIKSDIARSARCDCSICRRRGSTMIVCNRDDLVVSSGLELLTEYRFNTTVAVHYFCSRCGIYTFHKMRKLPDKYAINAGCIANVDLSALTPVFIEGSKMYS